MHFNQAWYLHGTLGNAILITNIIRDIINTAGIKSELCDCDGVYNRVNEACCAIILYEVQYQVSFRILNVK